jgi:oxygen-independent coproporphyrinogen-3 oxidase
VVDRIAGGVSVAVFALATSGDWLGLYYRSVSLEYVNGVTHLVKEYGPFHSVYAVYLLVYVLLMVGIILYASRKKRLTSPKYTLFLLVAVLLNVGVWLVEQMTDEGRDAAAYMEREHLVSSQKAALAAEIADRERRILSKIHYEDGYSLYVGIPFCPTTCLYCSFTSFPLSSWRERVDLYLDTLEREMEASAPLMEGRILDTLYIGGGTPTTLEPEQSERLIRMIRQYFDLGSLQEFTVEAGRPDSITEEKLAVLRANGVSRISVNPQTMLDRTLKFIGRQHSASDTEKAFRMAREAGFDNINMDIILGLPGETQDDVQYTIDRITELGPDDLTVHSLAVKRASKLARWIEQNGFTSINNTDGSMAIAAAGAAEMGMHPYYLYRQKNMSGNFENVGYAKEGKAGIYNILIMEEKQSILALGAGSISKGVFAGGRIERCDDAKEVEVYIDHIEEMIERKRKLFG